MQTINVIKNVSSSNYEIDNQRLTNPVSVIRYIVIGMSNDLRTGNAYANSYTQQVKSPRITYNYVIDKLGNVYQTIDDKYVPFTIKDSQQLDTTINKDVISICLMPTWLGNGYGDEYDRESNFHQYPENGDQFILTKERTKIEDGVTKRYPIGRYEYKDEGWQLIERLSPIDVKRPYNSENWYIEEATRKTCLYLIKELQNKYSINNQMVLRVFDFNKMCIPAPYVIDEDTWLLFKNDLADINNDVHFVPITKENTDIDRDIQKSNPDMSVQEIIEKFGPEAGEYEYHCTNTDKCPYLNKLMTEQKCLLDGLDADLALKISSCPYRVKQIKSKTNFSGNAIIDVNSIPPTNKLNIEIGIHNQKDRLWRLSEVVKKCSWSTYIDGTVGQFDFSFHNKNNEVKIEEGFNVGYWIGDSVAGFNGNVFEIKQELKDKQMLDVTCFDFLQYLQNDVIISFEGKTASQIFDECCTALNLPHRVIDVSSYVCTSRNYVGDSWYKAINDAITETLAMTNKWYIIQPNFGVLEFRDITNQDNIKGIRFSEDSCIINGNFDTSIKESYNVIIGCIPGETEVDGSGRKVKFVADHKEAQDSSTIQKWGMLTKVEEISKDNIGSLQDWVNKRLQFYNSPRRKFTLNCIGIPGILAGNIIWLEIKDVASVGSIAGGAIVDKCTHIIENNKHTMELELNIVQDGSVQYNITQAIQNKAA